MLRASQFEFISAVSRARRPRRQEPSEEDVEARDSGSDGLYLKIGPLAGKAGQGRARMREVLRLCGVRQTQNMHAGQMLKCQG